MLLICKRRYFARLKILFLVCHKCVSAISKKKSFHLQESNVSCPFLQVLERHWDDPVPCKTKRNKDKIRICLVHAQHLKKPVPDEELWHLCCTSASHLCDCVWFVCAWMYVSVCLLSLCCVEFSLFMELVVKVLWTRSCTRLICMLVIVRVCINLHVWLITVN